MTGRMSVFIERLVLSLVIVLQGWIFLVVPTDNNGDPNDYLRIAKSLGTTISFNRFIGYPVIIKALSLNLSYLNLLFLFQSIFFIVALVCFAHSFGLPPLLRSLLYLPGLIPTVAYMQKLIFPDGIILSLLLILVAQIRSGKHVSAGAVALVLTAIKLVFVFVPVFVLALWANERKYLSKQTAYACFLVFVLCLVPVVYFITPFPLYQAFVQVPEGNDDAALVQVPKALELSCAGVEKIVTDPAILANLTKHTADELFMPLGAKAATDLGCTRDELRNLQRRLIRDSFLQAPSFQLKKIVQKWIRATFVFPQVDHLRQMFLRKYQLTATHYNESAFYDDTQLRYWREQQIPPLFQPGLLLFFYSARYEGDYNATVISTFFFLLVLLSPLVVWKCTKVREFRSEITPILVLVVAYAFLISCFAIVYDRYVYVNLFLWMAIIASTLREIFKARIILRETS